MHVQIKTTNQNNRFSIKMIPRNTKMMCIKIPKYLQGMSMVMICTAYGHNHNEVQKLETDPSPDPVFFYSQSFVMFAFFHLATNTSFGIAYTIFDLIKSC